jgi:hypothetical protein
MKPYHVLLFFIVLMVHFSCHNGTRSVQTVTLYFWCFGHPYTSFTLDFISDALMCRNYGYDPKLNAKKKQMVPEFEKNYSLDAETSDRLRKLFTIHAPDSVARREEEATDGYGFYIEYVWKENDTSKLVVINPRRNTKYKTDYLQIDEFFEVANAVISDSIGMSIVEETHHVYYEGLPIKKISEHPLIYKAWGEFSGCREDNEDLLVFLDNLSKEKCAMIEIGGNTFSQCLMEVIVEYSLKSNIVFIGDKDLLFWLRRRLTDIKKDLLDAQKRGINLEETPENVMELRSYQRDSLLFNEWLRMPDAGLIKSKEEAKQLCL